MQLRQQWDTTLQHVLDELSYSPTPLRSPTFSEHIGAMRAVLWRFSQAQNRLIPLLEEYRQVLRVCQEAIQQNERAQAIVSIRYLKVYWLPKFAKKV